MHHESGRRPDPPCLVLLSCWDILAPAPEVSGRSAVTPSPKHWRGLKSGLFCGRQCETAAGSGVPPAAGSTTSSLSSLRQHGRKKEKKRKISEADKQTVGSLLILSKHSPSLTWRRSSSEKPKSDSDLKRTGWDFKPKSSASLDT